MPVSKSTRATTRQNTTPKGSGNTAAAAAAVTSPTKAAVDAKNLKSNIKSPDSKKHLHDDADNDAVNNNNNNNKRLKKNGASAAAADGKDDTARAMMDVDHKKKNNGSTTHHSPTKPKSASGSAVTSPTRAGNATAASAANASSIEAIMKKVPSGTKNLKEKVLSELLSTTKPKPVHVKSSVPPSKVAPNVVKASKAAAAAASAAAKSSAGSRPTSPSKPAAVATNASAGKTSSATSPQQMSPTSHRILGKRPISKPHNAVVMEMKKIGSYMGVKPQEIVARVQSAPVKQNIVSQVSNMAKAGTVKLVPSSIAKSKKGKSGRARG